METKKLSLAKIQGKLTRNEMKLILAGNAEFVNGESVRCNSICNSDYDCGTECPRCKEYGSDLGWKSCLPN